MRKPLSILLILAFVSCSKGKSTNHLLGSWTLVEKYTMGCFCWQQVPTEQYRKYTFTSLGKFTLISKEGSFESRCEGWYRLLNDSTIVMSYNCFGYPVNGDLRQVKITDKEFIMDSPIMNVPYRDKYRRQ